MLCLRKCAAVYGCNLTVNTASRLDYVSTYEAKEQENINRLCKLASAGFCIIVYVWNNKYGKMFDLSGCSPGSHAQ